MSINHLRLIYHLRAILINSSKWFLIIYFECPRTTEINEKSQKHFTKKKLWFFKSKQNLSFIIWFYSHGLFLMAPYEIPDIWNESLAITALSDQDGVIILTDRLWTLIGRKLKIMNELSLRWCLVSKQFKMSPSFYCCHIVILFRLLTIESMALIRGCAFTWIPKSNSWDIA